MRHETVPVITERGGFEPAVRFDPHTAFPVPHNRPLCHLSGVPLHDDTCRRKRQRDRAVSGIIAVCHPLPAGTALAAPCLGWPRALSRPGRLIHEVLI